MGWKNSIRVIVGSLGSGVAGSGDNQHIEQPGSAPRIRSDETFICTCGAFDSEGRKVVPKKKKKGLLAKAKRLSNKILKASKKQVNPISSPEECPRCSRRFAWDES
eukprot:TRINITY_DN24090_c0_g1_i1.p3 TRINITY_DN24090_c0_g1~~TRINITY_DN24090_c0_g1_i1.p3  ORF type:complete len:106 (+),score=16.96 TRINITY_DN24090_c0_g1_i1:129-446(+)